MVWLKDCSQVSFCISLVITFNVAFCLCHLLYANEGLSIRAKITFTQMIMTFDSCPSDGCISERAFLPWVKIDAMEPQASLVKGDSREEIRQPLFLLPIQIG